MSEHYTPEGWDARLISDLSLTSAFICSSSDRDQSSYHVEWLSLINFSRYWSYQLPWLSIKNFSRFLADMVFALNATVTLTFDLVTSKFVRLISWIWPIFLLSTMTVAHKLFKILSGHCFCIKCYCDLGLWPSDLKMYICHLMTMTNLPTT